MFNILVIRFFILFTLFSTILVASTVLEFTPQEKQFIKTHPQISVANEMGWPPFDYNEYGKPKGLSIEHIQLIAKKIGIEINFVNGYSWSELIEQFKKKKIDIMPVLYKNAERETFTLFSNPYYKGKLGIFFRTSGTNTQTKNLVNRRVGIERNHGAIPIIRNQLKGINLVEIDNNSELVTALATGKLDAIIGNPSLFYFYAKENQIINIEIKNYIKLNDSDQLKTSFHIGIRNDWPLLQSIINKTMEALTNDDMHNIKSRWIGFETVKENYEEIPLSKAEKAYLKTHPSIKVSNEDDWAPFDFSIDGEAKGYSIDVIKLLAKKIGMKVTFINGYTWSELLREFDKKNIDLMHVMSKDKERAEKYSFSKQYMPWKLSWFIRKDEKDINSFKDFDGKKVAAGKDWSTTKEFKKLYPKAIVIEYKNTLEMIEALSISKVDACIDNALAVNYIMSKNIITNIKNAGNIDLKDTKSGFHFVSHRENPELASIFDKAFDSLSVNEKIKLQEKWFYVKNTNNKYLTKDEKKWIKNNPTILVGGEMDWAPFDFVSNGKYQGITNDYLNLISKKIGLKFKIETGLTWDELVESFKAKEIDILPAVYYSPSRKKFGKHTRPYYNVRDYIFVKDDSTIKSIKDFRGKVLAIPKGYTTGGKIQKIYPDINILETRSIIDSISAVLNGEADGTIEVQAVMSYILKTNAIEGIKVIAQDNLEAYPLGMLVQKDNEILLSIINKTIQNIDKDEQSEITKKWITIYYDEFLDKQTLIYLGLAFLLTIIILSVRHYYTNRLNKELQLLASTDSMTKLYNRRYFMEMSESLLDLAKRNKTDISIIMLDIDKFKNINDTYGHKVGDDVIISLASALQKQSRKSDIICRWGGEEFVVLLPNTNSEGSLVIAEKIRKVTENLIIKLKGNHELKFTISLGISEFNYKNDINIETSINRADEALYEAKESGRNKVCIKI